MATVVEDVAFRAGGTESDDARRCVGDLCYAVGTDRGEVRDSEGEVC